MPSIDTRIAAIAAALERRRMEQVALLAEANHGDPLDGTDSLDLDMEALERFIADYQEL